MQLAAGFAGKSGTTPSGSPLKRSASALASFLFSTIRSSTRLRRAVALSGCFHGSLLIGLFTRPASSAACGTVSFSGVVLKYACAAAPIP